MTGQDNVVAHGLLCCMSTPGEPSCLGHATRIVLYCICSPYRTLRVMTGPEYWRPRAVLWRSRKKGKGDVGVEKERGKEEKMEILFCSVHEFLTDAGNFDVTNFLVTALLPLMLSTLRLLLLTLLASVLVTL